MRQRMTPVDRGVLALLLTANVVAANRMPFTPSTDGSSFGDASRRRGAPSGSMRGDLGGVVLPKAGGGNTLSFQLVQKPLRTRRRLAGAPIEFEDTPLFPGYGTHFAYIYVGTPPQRVSVIVDTGSHFTAFPCVGCDNCGDHTDPYYDYHTSSTGSVVDCDECQVNFRCSRGAKEGECQFSQSYSEGSSWSAFQVRDKMWVGELTLGNTPVFDRDFAVEMMFGCINSQTGLFRTQLADGIMGMSANEYTLPWQMVKQGVTRDTTFSLCLSEGGGTMTLGGSDPLIAAGGAKSPVIWSQLSKNSGWFTVEVLDVEMGGETIGAPAAVYNAGKGTIVDSGTTDTYLPEGCAAQFKARWKKLTGTDYKNSKFSFTDKQVDSLPVLTFVFKGDVRVNVLPRAYMEKEGDKQWTPRVYVDESSGGVLGANFMREHNIIFDHDANRIGFQDAECDYQKLLQLKKEAAQLPAPAPSPAAPAVPISDAPTQDTGRPTDCTYSGIELIKPCDAKCLLGAPTDSVAQGTETWGPIVTAPARNGGSCPATEQRPCTVECKAGAANPNASSSSGSGNGGSGGSGLGITSCAGAGAWGVCGGGCQQSRVVSWPSEPLEGIGDQGGGAAEAAAGSAPAGVLGGCSVETETRPCRVGDMCRYGAMGLLVTAALEACFPGAPSGGGESGGAVVVPVWTGSMSDAVSDAVARLLAMDPGDVTCSIGVPDGGGEAAAAGGGEQGSAAAKWPSSAPCFKLPLAVHLTPVVNADLSTEVAMTLGGHDFGAQLSRLANDDAEARLQSARAGPVTLAVLQPVLVLQAASRAPYAAALGRTAGPERRTSSGPVVVFSVLAAVAAGTCLVLAMALVRRRRQVGGGGGGSGGGGSGGGKRGEYQLVERGASSSVMGGASWQESSDGAELGISSSRHGLTGSRHRASSGGNGGNNGGGVEGLSGYASVDSTSVL